MPVAAFSTSAMTAGSRPKRWPISNASMPIRNPPVETRLFSAFIAWPEPTAPVRSTDVPIADSTGIARSIDRRVAAHHDRELPVFARGTPPETGASIRWPPSACTLLGQFAASPRARRNSFR